MTGGKDPANRGCFRQEAADKEVAGFYKKILSFRRSIDRHEELGTMELIQETPQSSTYTFQRKGRSCRLLVAVNAGETEGELSLQLSQNERLEDFIIAGNAAFKSIAAFSLRGISAVAALITERK